MYQQMELGRWSLDLNVSHDFKGKHHINCGVSYFFINFDKQNQTICIQNHK